LIRIIETTIVGDEYDGNEMIISDKEKVGGNEKENGKIR
jgi:hypothetical protein